MADELPDPPYGPDVDLKDFAFTPIYRARLFGSSFHARVNDAEWRAGVTLWLKSQDQMPAGTLPTDDVDLCRLAELGRDMRTWKKLRTGALHGWYRCSDGRLYHPVVAEVVQDQWLGKLRQKWRADCARVKKYCQRHNQKFEPPDFEEWLSQGQRCNVPGTDGESPEDNDPPSPGNGGDVPRENHSKGQGEGQGQGQGQGDSMSPDADASGRGAHEDVPANTPHPAKGRKNASGNRKTTITPDWWPDEQDREYAHGRGHNDEWIDGEAEGFRDRCLASPDKHSYVDWHAAWRTSVRYAEKFASRDYRPNGVAGRPASKPGDILTAAAAVRGRRNVGGE